MNPTYFAIFALFLILFIMNRYSKMYIAKKFIKNKRRKDKDHMLELAKKFIDKECLIYTFNSNQIDGVIKEVSNGALLVEKKGALEAINLDFVVRIREYPKNKNGKKKSVVID